MQFLEKEPNFFECEGVDGHWSACKKEAICSQNLVNYRPVKSDPEFLDNWVDKLGLLCESQKRVGFLGSSYFLGIIIAMIFIPYLSDIYGRKKIFCLTMVASIIGQVGLIVSTNLYSSTLYMVLLGMTWPGKRVTGLSYNLEFLPEIDQNTYLTLFTLFDYPSIFLISLSYEYLTPSWYPIQALGVVLSCVTLAYCMVLMPESPKFLFINHRYEELRQILNQI